ncbi:hypothetical protein ACP4OV_031291 [Aristida adscensionis]
MSTPRSSATALGLIILLSAVSVGVNSGSGGPVSLLLSFTAVLVGVSLVAIGVRTADGAAASLAAASFPGHGGPRVPFPRRGLALVGLIIASAAATALAGEADPVLCFGCFALLLVGISLITIGVRGQRRI